MYRKRDNRNRRNINILFENQVGTEFIVFDTETTGLKSEIDYIVELAAQKYRVTDNKKGSIEKIQELHVYLKPPFYMDQSVIDVHGITNDFLSDKPTESELFPVIKDFFTWKDAQGRNRRPIILGYNVDFDMRMLDALYARQDETLDRMFVMDILEMSRDLVVPHDVETYIKARYVGEPEVIAKKLGKIYQLGNLVGMYGLDNDIQFHSAADDTEATCRLLRCFYNEYKKLPKPGEGLLSINFTYYFKGFNKEQAGLWVDTNAGKLFFSTFNKAWMSATINLDKINIDTLEKDIYERLGITYEELSKMTEKKFDAIKETLRQEGRRP